MNKSMMRKHGVSSPSFDLKKVLKILMLSLHGHVRACYEGPRGHLKFLALFYIFFYNFEYLIKNYDILKP